MKNIANKGKFIKTLPSYEYEAGLIKFNIPDEDDIYSNNGEGVWGWVTPEDKEKYNDDSYTGQIVAILLNSPLNYYGRLNWGDEVVLDCHGEYRPTLSPEWVKEYICTERTDQHVEEYIMV